MIDPNSRRLEQRGIQNVAVTGTSRGIGAALSKAFLATGASVVGCSRTAPTWLSEVTSDQRSRYHHVTADLADASHVINFAREVTASVNALDALINNAGYFVEPTPVHRLTLSVWERMLAVNVTAPFLITKELLPLLTESDGCIVNVSSSAAAGSNAGWAAYSCSKAALEALTRVLACERTEEGPKVISVWPRRVLTGMRRLAHPEEDSKDLLAPTIAAGAIIRVISEMGRLDSGSNIDLRDYYDTTAG